MRQRRQSRISLSLGLVLSLFCATTRAAPLEPGQVAKRLAEGRALYGEQEYAKAIPVLRSVTESTVATTTEKVSAFEVLGLSYFILGQEKRAREAFENLLALDPEHTLVEEGQSPKILRFYDGVKAAYTPGYRAGPAVALDVLVPNRARGGQRLDVRVRVVRGVKEVTDVRVFFRSAGVLSYTAQQLSPIEPGRYEGQILPPAEPAAWTLEYYVEARAGTNVRGRFGDPLRPLSLSVEAAAAATTPAWYQRWWVWTAVGAVVIGGVVVGVTSRGSPAPPGTLGPVIQLK